MMRALAFMAATWIATVAFAQKDAAEARSQAFVAVQGAQKEDVPGGKLLVSAYAVVMVLLVGYVARLGFLQRKTSQDVERLAGTIARVRDKG